MDRLKEPIFIEKLVHFLLRTRRKVLLIVKIFEWRPHFYSSKKSARFRMDQSNNFRVLVIDFENMVSRIQGFEYNIICM